MSKTLTIAACLLLCACGPDAAPAQNHSAIPGCCGVFTWHDPGTGRRYLIFRGASAVFVVEAPLQAEKP